MFFECCLYRRENFPMKMSRNHWKIPEFSNCNLLCNCLTYQNNIHIFNNLGSVEIDQFPLKTSQEKTLFVLLVS